MNTRGEEDHRLGAQPRERKKKPGERVLRNKTVFSLPAAKKRGRPEKQSEPATRGQTPPVSDPPLTFLSSPLSLFFFFHSSHLLYLPPLPLQKRVTLGHYFHFLNPTFTLLATWLTVALEWLTGGACTSVFESVLNHSFGMCWALIDLVIQIKKLTIESFE